MSDESKPQNAGLSAAALRRIERVCVEFEAAWKSGRPRRIEDYLGGWQGQERSELLQELLFLDLDYRSRRHEHPTPDEYRSRFPGDRELVSSVFETFLSHGTHRIQSKALRIRCPHCRHPIQIVDDDPLAEISCSSCGSSFRVISGQTTEMFQCGETKALGRFELIELIGQGHFGSVWKGRDRVLDRTVAANFGRADRYRPAFCSPRFGRHRLAPAPSTIGEGKEGRHSHRPHAEGREVGGG